MATLTNTGVQSSPLSTTLPGIAGKPYIITGAFFAMDNLEVTITNGSQTHVYSKPQGVLSQALTKSGYDVLTADSTTDAFSIDVKDLTTGVTTCLGFSYITNDFGGKAKQYNFQVACNDSGSTDEDFNDAFIQIVWFESYG